MSNGPLNGWRVGTSADGRRIRRLAASKGTVPESHNGHRPLWPEGDVHAAGLGPRVMAWMDFVIGHLIPEHRRRKLIQRSRDIDHSLERVAHRLRRRHR